MLLKKNYRKEMAKVIDTFEKELTKDRMWGELHSGDINKLTLKFYRFISYFPQYKGTPQYELVRKILVSLKPGDEVSEKKYRLLVSNAMEIISMARADLAKGIKACPYCKAEMPIEANYCGVCGKNLYEMGK